MGKNWVLLCTLAVAALSGCISTGSGATSAVELEDGTVSSAPVREIYQAIRANLPATAPVACFVEQDHHHGPLAEGPEAYEIELLPGSGGLKFSFATAPTGVTVPTDGYPTVGDGGTYHLAFWTGDGEWLNTWTIGDDELHWGTVPKSAAVVHVMLCSEFNGAFQLQTFRTVA